MCHSIYYDSTQKGGIPLKTSVRLTMLSALLVFLIAISVNVALAQTFQPPQIPGYNAPPDEQDNANNVIIPSEPSNPGVPKTEPTMAPTPTSENQPDYGLIFLAIIIAVPIIGVIAIWTAWAISKKRKNVLPLPPPPT